MASTRKRLPEEAENGALDAKTVLYGACGLIVLLATGLTGLWSLNINQHEEQDKRIAAAQWDALKKLDSATDILNNQVITNTGRITRMEQDRSDMEARLRELERRNH